MSKDLAGVDYSTIGKGSGSKGAGFEKYSFRITLPKRLKSSGDMLLNKIEYSKTNINYKSDPGLGGDVSNFYSVTYSLGYVHKLKNDWALISTLSPSVSSNFSSSINWEDIRLFGMLMVSKQINPNKKLDFGVAYSTTLGRPFPMPMFNMMWKLNQKWTFNLGFPRMAVLYQLTKNTTLGTDLFMTRDNLTLCDDLYKGNRKIDNLQIMNLGGGIEVSQKLSKYLKLKLSSGYTFYRQFDFMNGGDTVKEYDLDNNLYIKAGISIGM
ncbi:DUF6268 family outer membrane beta-barrel protein [Labilibaculum filiforme]|nr:DUF6268 family outer membrane beta-barrel protein [Labilibaculum filiforme]